MWKEGLTRVPCKKLVARDEIRIARMLLDENTKRVCSYGRFGDRPQVDIDLYDRESRSPETQICRR